LAWFVGLVLFVVVLSELAWFVVVLSV